MSTLLQQFSNEMASLSTAALRSLVQIKRGAHGIGSGGIWSSDGLIITNAHVVGDVSPGRGRWGSGRVSNDLRVTLADGREVAGKVVAVDPANDLAALQVDAQNLPAFTLGDSRALLPGEMVWALGYPWGVQGGATVGTVIGVGSGVGDLDAGGRDLLAASLHLRPGHSGGPMVDAQGRLVGINSMMNGLDVGVAIPVHVAARFLGEFTGNAAAKQQPSVTFV